MILFNVNSLKTKLSKIKMEHFVGRVHQLIKLMKTIFESRGKSPLLKALLNYESIFKNPKAKKESHFNLFKSVYNKSKQQILKDGDEWVKKGFIVHFGSDVGINTNAKLYISSAYGMACEIRDKICEDLTTYPNEKQTELMNLPNNILSYLYSIFILVADRSDTDALEQILDKINGEMENNNSKSKDTPRENNANKYVVTNKVSNEPGTAGTADSGSANNNDDFLKNMMNMLPPAFKEMTGGKDMPNLDLNNLKNTFNNIFSNPKTQQFVGGLIKDMQSADSLESVVTKVISKVNDPELKQLVSETVIGEEKSPQDSNDKLKDELEDFDPNNQT